MSSVTQFPNAARDALTKAKQEIAEESLKTAVEQFKRKLREREAAAVILANIDRELADLEQSTLQGNN